MGRGGSLSSVFAALVVRFRYLVVAGWSLAVVAAIALLPPPAEAKHLGLGNLIPEDAQAIQTEIRSLRLFRFPVLGRTSIVQRDPKGLSVEAQARIVRRAVRLNQRAYPELRGIAGALPVINTLGLFPGSKERGTTAVTYLFFAPDTGVPTRVLLAHRFAHRYVSERQDALVGITGPAPARHAQATIIERALPKVEIATLVLIAAIAAIAFRSLVAPVVILAAGGIAYAVSIPLVAWTGRFLGTSAPEEVEPVIVVLLLGIVTDYSIFFIAGARERLVRGATPTEATAGTTEQFFPIILTAGLTVAAGTAALLVASLGFLRAFAPGLVVSVLTGLLVSVTFVPAALGIIGRGVFWPRSIRLRDGGASGRDPGSRVDAESTWTAVFSKRRGRASVLLVISLAALGWAGYEFRNANLGFSLVGALPAGSEPKRAASAAALGFPAGILSPTQIVVEGEGVGRKRKRLARLQEMIERQPGVAAVIGPKQQPLGLAVGAIISRNLDAVRYIAILGAPPLSGEAVETVETIKSRIPHLLAGTGLPTARASFAGDTALVQETIERTIDDLVRIGAFTLVVDLLLLSLFLRSLVAPFYLLALSVLGLLATLGLTVLLFQDVLDHPGITYYVPIAAAVLLVSLGSDYNIFIAGRIWDEARKRRLPEAIAVGAQRAAEAITIAGITLAGTFALLAIVPLRPFRALAFVMAAGVLIDSFLVRSLLVPAVVTLVGGISEWPSHRFWGRRRARRRELGERC